MSCVHKSSVERRRKDKYSHSILPPLVRQYRNSLAEKIRTQAAAKKHRAMLNPDWRRLQKSYEGRQHEDQAKRRVSSEPPRPSGPLQTWSYSLVTSKPSKQKYETGIYEQDVQDKLDLITRENSVMLPPLKTSRRVQSYVPDGAKVAEKEYIMSDYERIGKVHKFARDEMFLPSIYRNFFSCRDCRLKYVSEKYTQSLKTLNAPQPVCKKIKMTRAKKHAHFCDVLGKRFCHECAEADTREIGHRLMEDMTNSPGTTSHSTSPFSSPREPAHSCGTKDKENEGPAAESKGHVLLPKIISNSERQAQMWKRHISGVDSKKNVNIKGPVIYIPHIPLSSVTPALSENSSSFSEKGD